jgi:hypothetical protein
MKTDDLIAVLAQDSAAVSPRRAPGRLALACLFAVLGASAILMLGLGVRPDIHFAMRTPAFWMKAGYTLALALAGFALTLRFGRPGRRPGNGPLLVIAVVFGALALLGAVEMMSAPVAARPGQWLGVSWRQCPIRILAISAPAYLAIVWGLRGLAPTRLTLGGASAGLLAGALGATIYGLYCQETTAAFVVTWYSLGIAVCVALGALLGRRLLRW